MRLNGQGNESHAQSKVYTVEFDKTYGGGKGSYVPWIIVFDHSNSVLHYIRLFLA